MMPRSGATPKAREIALQLITYEAPPRGDANFPAAISVCEKLRRPLSTLTGAAGYRSLLVRALTLAKRGAPILEATNVKDDGSLEGPGHSAAGPGGDLLVSEFLGLLIAFIGDTLTMRLLFEIWPELANVELSSVGKK